MHGQNEETREMKLHNYTCQVYNAQVLSIYMIPVYIYMSICMQGSWGVW